MKKQESWIRFFLYTFINKINENLLMFGIFLIIIGVLLFFILLLHLPKTFSKSDLINYNSMFIVAIVFLLTYHLGELRDVTAWSINGKDSNGKKFYYDKENKNQPSGKDIAEVKIFYIGSVIFVLLLFVLSSLLVIIGICAPIALIFSLIASLIIIFLLIFTLRTYTKGIASASLNIKKEEGSLKAYADWVNENRKRRIP